jgi:hypothetical protein
MKRTDINTLVYGKEPVFDKLVYSQTEFIEILNWYNHSVTHDDIKEYTLNYFESLNKKEILHTLQSIPKTLFPTTLGSLCRILDRNYPVSDYILSKIDKLLSELLEATYEKELLKPVIDKKPAKVIDRVEEVIAEIDGYLDMCVKSQSFPKKAYDKYASNSKLTKKQKLEVAEYYMRLLDQLSIAEDYNFMSKAYNAYVALVNNIVTSFSNVTRKERVKKPVDLNKVVSKVKYLKEFTDLGLKSINPKDIIGKKYLLCYDVKYRKLSLIVAEGELSVRGSTIYGLDKSLCISKMVKQPEIIANKFMKGNFEYVLGSFRLLKTKISIPSGSLNENVLILRVIE